MIHQLHRCRQFRNGTPTLVNQRRGISLLEILISIGIMGIGLIALATLFPLGLLRVKSATDSTRSVFLAESAEAEIRARGLLRPETFTSSWYWYNARNPFVQDTNPSSGLHQTFNANGTRTPEAVYRGLRYDVPFRPGKGLPVAYDPLWWAFLRETDPTMDPALPPTAADPNSKPVDRQLESDARFGSGVYFVSPTHPGGLPSCIEGLQRLTNFRPYSSTGPDSLWPLSFPNQDVPTAQNVAADIFVAPEDIVYQQEGDTIDPYDGVGAQVVPIIDPSLQPPNRDWIFTWMITGQMADSGKLTVFEGDIVIHRNRTFGFYPVTPIPGLGTRDRAPLGERVVEAIWGYSESVVANPSLFQYSTGDPRQVALLWRADDPFGDLDLRAGAWIADVTYSRSIATDDFYRSDLRIVHPAQRCHWYQVTKRSEPVTVTHNNNSYRRMIVTVNTPVKAKTLNVQGNWMVESALYIPSVVNVFPRTFNVK